MNDHEMTDLLERATRGVHGTQELVAGGVRRGQRREGRKRLSVLAGAVAVAAVVTTTATLGPFGDKASDPDKDVAASVVKPKSAQAPAALPPKLERLQRQLLATVPAGLPAGTIYGPTVDFDPLDGTGQATVQAIVAKDPMTRCSPPGPQGARSWLTAPRQTTGGC